MIKKLLIANRGEIAVRIIKTAKKMGIETHTVYSEIDVNAQHVELADYAYSIGPAPSQQSYLQQTKIIDLAKAHHLDAIHPGYGFLSENASFAERCEQAQIIFVGPRAAAIKKMGNKAQAKALMQQAGIPTTPGYAGDKQTATDLLHEAQKLGFPLLIKAVCGGGGKGMRLVNTTDEFEPALQAAKDEARANFGDDTVLLEKYLTHTRHVEVQIIADSQGNIIYLFDRDCSVQRRHQKVIEEAPAPGLSADTHQALGETAVKAARAINYQNAGTIEFLLDEQHRFYFMEMNTRLQVEHPVTEMITGVDLVEWQLKIAAGHPLPQSQQKLQQQGVALEARLCAEDPDNHFLPSTGTLKLLQVPPQTKDTRIDSGVKQGDLISPYYDSMIAKLIVVANTREQAIDKLKTRLEHTYIAGVKSNVTFLHRILSLPEFATGALHTDLISQHQETLSKNKDTLTLPAFALAASTVLKKQQQDTRTQQTHSSDTHSPWFLADRWRLLSENIFSISLWQNNTHHRLTLTTLKKQSKLCYQKKSYLFKIVWHNPLHAVITFENERINAACHYDSNTVTVFISGEFFVFQDLALNTQPSQNIEDTGQFTAPMPSTVVEVFVTSGQPVKAGEKLMVLEAMKMQHTITAPNHGVIEKIHYQKGDLLNEGAILIDFSPR